MGVCTYTFLPLEEVTPKAQEIYAKAKASVEQLEKEGAPPGLLDQYKIQLERLEPGKNQKGPGCEIIFGPALVQVTPGVYSATSCIIVVVSQQSW